MNRLLYLLPCSLLFVTFGINHVYAQNQYPFQNPDLSIEERIDNIISLMTVEEKVAFLSSSPSVPRLGIRRMGHAEGLHGMAQGGPSNWGARNPHPTTIFPQSYGMGETWDTDLMRQAGAAEAYEARYMVQNEKIRRSSLIIRAPNADMGRDPRWGRTEECYGEDPFLNGTLAVAFIKGLQGDDPKYWLSASLLKHFLANSNEDNRTRTSSNFDDRLFYEYYSVPFRMGFVEGGARCFMTAYNLVNKIPCTVHPVIKDVTVKQWGVDGIICTDAGAFGNLYGGQKYYSDAVEAGAGSVKAGINQYLDRNYVTPVKTALQDGRLTNEDLDENIKGTLRVFIRLGLLDPPDRVPYAKIGAPGEPDPCTTDKHKTVALRVTQASIVLLKNSQNLLPLDKTKLKSIAVVGPLADQVLLDWYSGTPPYTITPFDGIKKKIGPGKLLICSASNDAEAAVKAAGLADAVIVCVGNHPTGDAPWAKVKLPSYGKEAVDRQSITLEDEELVKQVYQANPNTVVVLISSFPYAINWTQENVPAIVHMTHSSQEQGSALADVIFGDYNPAGRLVQTWPKSLDQVPDMMDYDIRHGRTYMYFKGEPLYPFGYGLSYTTFAYSNLKTSSKAIGPDDSITVNVDVKNTGKRAGEEVVQLYVKYLNPSVERPIKELKGFKRIPLEPGETKTVTMPLKGEQLSYWDLAQKRFVVENGKIQIEVGPSSADNKVDAMVDVAQ
jgi:beta-glucosidase